MKIVSAFAIVNLVLIAATTNADVIDFDDLPTGTINGTFQEDGFSLEFVDMFISDNGNPGNELERIVGTDGLVTITSVDLGSDFQFISIDIENEGNVGIPEVTITGFNDGQVIGVDVFDVVEIKQYFTFQADNLFGLSVDEIQIAADRVGQRNTLASIDNITLQPQTIPEPACTLCVLLLGIPLVRRYRANSPNISPSAE